MVEPDKHGLERCHITPRWKNGRDDVENLHLLCFTCHWASERFDGRSYWKWFARWDFTKKLQIIGLIYGARSPYPSSSS